MKTMNYILRDELNRAAGGAGGITVPRIRSRSLPAGKGNVVDLAAWKAENLAEPDGQEAGGPRVSVLGQYGGRELVRRSRKSEAALNRAELAATLAVTAALAALVVRVLLF